MRLNWKQGSQGHGSRWACAAASDPSKPSSTQQNRPDKAAILARIAKAKEYKESSSDVTPMTTASVQAPYPLQSSVPLPSTQQLKTEGKDAEVSDIKPASSPPPSQGVPERSGGETADLIFSSRRGSGSGSAEEAADFLVNVLANNVQMDSNMRMEEYSLAKEERVKQMGADIFTRDANSTSASTSEPDTTESYKPTVSTWGVFPRPANISSAYGGGRNLKPGQELETADQKKDREQKYNDLLKKYKEATGGYIDPSLEDEATTLYNEGMKLFESGLLRAAYAKFDGATTKAPLRTKIGGLANLQKAICMDAFGMGKEAEQLYRQLRNHSTGYVARKAKQMIFSYEAMSILKTTNLNLGVKGADYAKYFRGIADRNKVYIATPEDREADEQLSKLSNGIAVMVLLAPLALFAVLLGTKS